MQNSCMLDCMLPSFLKINKATLKAMLSQQQVAMVGRGHMITEVCGDPTYKDMSYNHCMTRKHGQCVKINL